MAKLPFATVDHLSHKLFDIVHTDVWGPSPILSNLGFRYFVVFVDDHSRFSWIFPLKNKSDVFSTFINFENHVKLQFNCSIKAIHSDWGGEFQKLHTHLLRQGIIHRLACPYTHEQNGLAERKIRHIVDTGLTLLAHASIPQKYWSYAFISAVSSINNLPSTSINNQVPYTLLYNKPVNYLTSKIFGCEL